MTRPLPTDQTNKHRWNRIRSRSSRRWKSRRGASSLELVMTTAIVLPLSGFAFYAGVQALQFIFSVDSALLLAPY